MKFTEKHFDFGEKNRNFAKLAARIANSLLPELKRQWLEELKAGAPVMYCRQNTWMDGSHMLWAADECPHFARATHRALLTCIEPLPREGE